MKQHLSKLAHLIADEVQLPTDARRIRANDRKGLPEHDPGISVTIAAATDWLCRAQDESVSADGGVARDFSLINGWATSYPETTGYIIPTLLDLAEEQQNEDLRDRARRMLDWLVAIQFPDGGFQGGKIDATRRVPVTFNTGQILLGLARGAADYGEPYIESMHRAANWLVDSLDPDGCWRQHPTPFAKPGEKTYETHVAWSLLEAARVAPDHGYGDAGLRNVRWAMTNQHDNGWFADCCLSDPDHPLTHTLGYALRGIVEAWRFSEDESFLSAARKTANVFVRVTEEDGRLAGMWSRDWTPAANWVCLTGSVQIAHSLLLLYESTGYQPYLDTGRALNAWVRRTVTLDGPDGIRGGIKGSFPIDGAYGRFEYLNWAAKFFIDSNRCEQAILHP